MSVSKLCDQVSSMTLQVRKCPQEFSQIHRILQNTRIKKRFAIYLDEFRKQILHMIGPSRTVNYFCKGSPLNQYLQWINYKTETNSGAQARAYATVFHIAYKQVVSLIYSFSCGGSLNTWIELHSVAMGIKDKMRRTIILKLWCTELVFMNRLKSWTKLRKQYRKSIERHTETAKIMDRILNMR